MDKHDEQFESFLRQFRLRKVSPLPEIVLVRYRVRTRWFLVAAAVVLVVGLSAVLVHKSGSGTGPRATVEAAGNPSLYRVGETIESDKVIRSNSAVGLLLALEDGSRVEMHAQSELKLESAADGIRVRLNDGSIVVTAAKQGAGHLYVQTRDALVSVVGTVFLVNAEQSGTTVGVVEGEVHVQQGADSKKLLPGEQVATNPAIKLKTVAEEISWSRNATEYVALLQQPSPDTAPSSPAPVASSQIELAPQVKYNEVFPASTRLSGNVLPFKVKANYVRVTSDEVRTLITIQFMNRDLAFQDEGGGKRAKLHIAGDIRGIDNRRLGDFSEDVLQEFPSNTFAANLDQPTFFQETRNLPPGKYKVHFAVEDMNSQSIGVQDYMLNVPRIPDQSLQVSSLILAYSVTDLPQRTLGTDMFALGEKRVKPNVTGVFRTNENLNVWQEIYGLTADQASRKPAATIELLISQNKQEIRKLTSSSTDLLGAGQKMTYTNSVPLGNFAPGPYDVQVKVTDNLAKVSLVTVGTFSVASPASQSDSSRNSAGRQILDRSCTSCHDARIAMMDPGMRVSRFSPFDRMLLSNKQAELEQLLNKGLTTAHPDVMRVQADINLLTARAYDAVRSYGSFVSSHLTQRGGTIPPTDVPVLAQYLFEENGKTTDRNIPSDIPLQRQDFPPRTPLVK